MKQRTAGTLMVIASASGFATLAIFVKFAYAAGVNIVTMLTGRFLIAALILWVIVKMKQIPVSLDKKTIIKLFLLGTFGYGIMSVLFASSLHYLPASLAAMLLYAYPALVSLMAFSLGDEKFSRAKGIALLVCFWGLFLVLGVSFENARPIGIILGLGSAIVYSSYIIVSNLVLKTIHPLVTTTFVCSSAGISMLLAGLAGGMQSLSFSAQGWLAILGMSVLGTIVGILGFFSGMSRIGPANASIISTMEPVFTVILSAILLGENITLIQGCGGALIIAGVLMLQLWSKDADQKNEPPVSVQDID